MKTTPTKILVTLALCVTFGVLISGCASPGSGTTVNTTTATKDNNQAQTASGGGDKIGVPDCDDYLEKYQACLQSKVPEASRAIMNSSFETTRKSWKEAAATPQGRASLAQACKAARDAAKQSMASFGCNW